MKRGAIATDRVVGPILRRFGFNPKGIYEYAYWKSRQIEEGTLGNDFYESMFTDAVGLDREFYAGKSILDVGCGPRGSLEWASHSDERVGLDPLVSRYQKLGIDRHEMSYVDSPAESMPFDDGKFDVVASFNALDHVDDVDATLAEMHRVLAGDGMLVLVVDIHSHPTVAEPHAIPWDLSTRLAEHYDVVEERHLEKSRGHDYLVDQIEFDHSDPSDRYGSLIVRGLKRA